MVNNKALKERINAYENVYYLGEIVKNFKEMVVNNLVSADVFIIATVLAKNLNEEIFDEGLKLYLKLSGTEFNQYAFRTLLSHFASKSKLNEIVEELFNIGTYSNYEILGDVIYISADMYSLGKINRKEFLSIMRRYIYIAENDLFLTIDIFRICLYFETYELKKELLNIKNNAINNFTVKQLSALDNCLINESTKLKESYEIVKIENCYDFLNHNLYV